MERRHSGERNCHGGLRVPWLEQMQWLLTLYRTWQYFTAPPKKNNCKGRQLIRGFPQVSASLLRPKADGKTSLCLYSKKKKKVPSWDKMIKLCLSSLSDLNSPCTFGLQLRPKPLCLLAVLLSWAQTFWPALQFYGAIERQFYCLEPQDTGWGDRTCLLKCTQLHPSFTSIPWQSSAV